MKHKNFFLLGIYLPIIHMHISSGHELKKLFFHNGGTITDRIVCYFDEKPQFNVEQKQLPNKTILVLSISCAMCQDTEVCRTTKKINDDQQEDYKVSINPKDKHNFQIIIAYNPKKILCNVNMKETISQYQSLIITLHKKEVLETLKIESDKLLKQAYYSPKKKRIIVDCGHGGSDLGKIGVNEVAEKNINLAIGKHLEKILKQRGYFVELTRIHDVFISLDERTSQSNRKKGDIFISIHANSAQLPHIVGIETYWTEHSSLSKIFFNEHKYLQASIRFHDYASKLLADNIHKQVLHAASSYYTVNDRKVKQAISQVLLGTQMPAALMELGFLSNVKEAELLAIPDYQKKLAYGICKGIDNYFQEIKDYGVSC